MSEKRGLGLVLVWPAVVRYTFHMSRGTLLVLLGFLVIISPFSGLPLSWLAWILPILGLIILGIGISVRTSTQGKRSEGDLVS